MVVCFLGTAIAARLFCSSLQDQTYKGQLVDQYQKVATIITVWRRCEV